MSTVIDTFEFDDDCRGVTEHVAASVLNVSKRTLQKWRLIGHGPVYAKYGSCVRYPIRELRAYLEASKRNGIE
jgi:hypothetical protein